MAKDKHTKFTEKLNESDVRSLCALLLLRRSVDGLNGRIDKNYRFEDYDLSITDFLEHEGFE